MDDGSTDIPQNTLSPLEVTNRTKVPATPAMPSSSTIQTSQIPFLLPSWLSHSLLAYYQNLLGLIPPLATSIPHPDQIAGPSTTVPATIITTNTIHAPFDTPLPPFVHLSTSTPPNQPNYHAHYQAQFQAIASQLAAIQ